MKSTQETHTIAHQDHLLLQAKNLVNSGFIDEAILIYRRLQDTSPLFPFYETIIHYALEHAYTEQTRILRCQSYKNTGLHVLVIDEAKLIANADANKEALSLLAVSYQALNDLKTAETYFEKLFQSFPDDFNSRYLYCKFLVETQKKQAYEAINAAIKRFPDAEAFYLLRTEYFVKKNWLKCAMLVARDMQDKFPDSSSNYFNLIRFAFLLKKPVEAFELFNQFEQRFPHNRVLMKKINELAFNFNSQEAKVSESARPSFLKEMQVKNLRESMKMGYRLSAEEVKDYKQMLERQTATKALNLERSQLKR